MNVALQQSAIEAYRLLKQQQAAAAKATQHPKMGGGMGGVKYGGSVGVKKGVGLGIPRSPIGGNLYAR